MKIQVLAATIAAVLVGSAGSAYAELTNVEIALIKADVNEDQRLSKAEVLLDALKGFTQADFNGNGELEAIEIGDLAEHPEFSDNDTDKSGTLSIDEVIAEKLADFIVIDANGDGFLDIEELRAAYPEQAK